MKALQTKAINPNLILSDNGSNFFLNFQLLGKSLTERDAMKGILDKNTSISLIVEKVKNYISTS